MHILVTAGNTLVPIDQVRGITNVFTGRTGGRIAFRAHARGHDVCLLTSHPEILAHEYGNSPFPTNRWTIQPYRTFDDLHRGLERVLVTGRQDALIHCAAISDYQPAGVYAPKPGTCFQPADSRWLSADVDGPALLDRAAGKVKSDEAELWLRLVRTPKLIDRVRGAWGFRGVLVKFKFEVGVGDDALLAVAERSRLHSGADLMVANTLAGKESWAYLGPMGGSYERQSRAELPDRLLDAVEALHRERCHG